MVAPPVDQVTAYPRLLRTAQDAYRRALAAQVQGVDPTAEWDEWERQTAAMLVLAWASGANATLSAAKVRPAELSDTPVLRFDRGDLPAIGLRFVAGPAREAVERYAKLIPMTRERWDALIEHAFQAAGELRDDEAANALERILDRNPRLAALVRGTPQPVKPVRGQPEEVRKRRTPAVQAAVQGSFFVTGMTQEQVTATRDLLASVIRGETTVSTAGKQVEEMGVGDFVSHAELQTGTDLTAARLETVYRTNINRAQSQGRLDIVRDSTVQRFVPLMMFRATKDRRTRDTHRAMDGFVATVDQIDGQGIPTPLGFNCRCTWSPVSIATAVSRGWCDDDGNPIAEAIRRHNGARQNLIDKGLVPDRGFISG